MIPFSYERATGPDQAVELNRAQGSKFLGGGTNLIDLMRERVEAPALLVDVSRLPGEITETEEGGLRIGAAVTNSALAEHEAVRARYPGLSRAVLAGASAQIRNMATVGGNLLQRTRCAYFYDVEGSRCNKRSPGQGCDALEGFNRGHAILGTSATCVATHPSDMCVALAAFGATVHLRGPEGSRTVPMIDFHLEPGETPDVETVLRPGELIEAVSLPPLPVARNSTYRKVRDRASYAFALVSVAAALDVEEGLIRDARLALGGVGTRPWRALRAEEVLIGAPAEEATFRRAAEAELAQAQTLSGNAFKPDLARRTTVAVLGQLAGTNQ